MNHWVGAMLAVTALAVTGGGARAGTSAVDSLVPPPPAVAPDSGSASGSATVTWPEGGRAANYLWVTRGSLLDRHEIDRLIERARSTGVKGLLVQVVGRGDAFYRSDRLPWPDALARPSPYAEPFDPLGYTLARAHAAGLEVHAWINCLLVWSAPRLPRDPHHVVHEHPEWVARFSDGRPLTQVSAVERKRRGIEGVFLNPAHPGVRSWIAGNAREIAVRYAVDGIHLDYIREPGDIGYDPDTRARFALESGVDMAKIDELPAARRAEVRAAWSEFHRAQVTAVVREVRDSLQAVRPGLPLSAAVIADTITAERKNSQTWRAWVRDGLLDRVFVMCYAPQVQTVLDQMVAYASELGTNGRVVPGIAVFNSSASAAIAKIQGALALGYRTLALYSYDSLQSRPGAWDALRRYLTVTPDATRP